MKVSIIVPVYKVRDEINRCLRSIITQNYQNLELILVNDCTPDDSFDLGKAYLEELGFHGEIKFLYHDVNRGLSAARNSGIRIATGQYLFFLDSDDELYDQNTITYLVSLVEMHGEPDLVMGSFERIVNGDNGEIYPLKDSLYLRNKEIFSAYAQTKLWMTAWGKLVSREFLIKHGLFFKDGIYHEDELWSFLLFRNVTSLYVTSIPVYKYYDRDNSITASITNKHIVDFITVVSEMYQCYLDDKEYFPDQTIILIGRLRREVFRRLIKHGDDLIFEREIKRLKCINLPITFKSTSLLKFNLFMKLPVKKILYLSQLKARFTKSSLDKG